MTAALPARPIRYANALFVPILIGLATRCFALALLGMTLVIRLFVDPGACPPNGAWAAALR